MNCHVVKAVDFHSYGELPAHMWIQILHDMKRDIVITEGEPCLLQQNKRTVTCSRRIILVAPDGVRYQCVSHLVRKVHPCEDLTKEKLGKTMISMVCQDYGYCAPCDGLGETEKKQHTYEGACFL